MGSWGPVLGRHWKREQLQRFVSPIEYQANAKLKAALLLTSTKYTMRMSTIDNKAEVDAMDKVKYLNPWKAADQFRERRNARGMGAILTNYLVIFGSICISTVTEYLNRMYPYSVISSLIAGMVRLAAMIVIASRFRAFENLVHEASHGNLFQDRNLHQHLEFLYAFPVLRLLNDYRASHMIHHRFLGDSKQDPDVIRIHKLGLDKLPQRPLLLLFGLPASGYLQYENLVTIFWDFCSSKTSWLSKTFYVITTTWLVSVTRSWNTFTMYYLIPLFIILPVLRFWAEAAEHVGLNMVSSLGHSRTNIGFWHRWLIHPHNDGYHTIHHVHSQVPFYQLPKAHNFLMLNASEYRRTTTISHSLSETFQQMVSNPTITSKSDYLSKQEIY